MLKHKNITLMLFRLNKQANNSEKRGGEKQTNIQKPNQTWTNSSNNKNYKYMYLLFFWQICFLSTTNMVTSHNNSHNLCFSQTSKQKVS